MAAGRFSVDDVSLVFQTARPPVYLGLSWVPPLRQWEREKIRIPFTTCLLAFQQLKFEEEIPKTT